MDPNYLKVNELIYDLKLRNLDSTGSVDIKRIILRGALSQENANRSFQETFTNPYLHDDDVKEIKQTLDELMELIL